MTTEEQVNNNVFLDEFGNPVQTATQYVDEYGNPIDPSLIDEFGNYIGNQTPQYVDEYGNPIDPSLIDEFGNYIGPKVETPTVPPVDMNQDMLVTPPQVDVLTDTTVPQETNQEVTEVLEPTQQVQQQEEEVPLPTPDIPTEQQLIENANINFVDQQGNVVDDGPVLPDTISKTAVADALSLAQTVEPKTTPDQTFEITDKEKEQNREVLHGMVTFDYDSVPIIDIVNSIILDSIKKGASDIHFDPFDDGIKIRIRIDGELNDYSIVPQFVKKNLITRIKIISGMNITETRTPQDGAIRTELQNNIIDLRVSCLPTNMGEKVVIRIMDYSMSTKGLDSLDFNENNMDKVEKMLSLPNGIILVTGATGSGKSTTVYSMLQRLNDEERNIITVEDPIEMNIEGINQVQAVPEIGLTFANVLRSILRQDPDVIMIGEIRDEETARIAVRASITGHIVLSTIHTNNSLNTIERLADMDVERYLLGSALSGIISQKLARRLCDKCRILRKTTDYEKEIFKKALNIDLEETYEAVGCSECNKGYHGRIAIQEVLLLNEDIKDGISKGLNKHELKELVYKKNNTQTMLQDGLEKVLEGKTTFDEILKLIDLEDDLGTDSQLGLEEQIEAIQEPTENATQVISSNSPININITPDVLKSLNLLQESLSDDDDDDEAELKPIKKKKKKKKKQVIEDIEEIEDDSEEIAEDEIVESSEEPEEDINLEDINEPLVDFNQKLDQEQINSLDVNKLEEEIDITPTESLDSFEEELEENNLENQEMVETNLENAKENLSDNTEELEEEFIEELNEEPEEEIQDEIVEELEFINEDSQEEIKEEPINEPDLIEIIPDEEIVNEEIVELEKAEEEIEDSKIIERLESIPLPSKYDSTESDEIISAFEKDFEIISNIFNDNKETEYIKELTIDENINSSLKEYVGKDEATDVDESLLQYLEENDVPELENELLKELPLDMINELDINEKESNNSSFEIETTEFDTIDDELINSLLDNLKEKEEDE